MNALMKHYKFASFFAIAAVVVSFLVWGWQVALVVAVLGLLETSLSFDNAVVNARVLTNWDDVWRKRFLMWGILIAVFGMRIVFPIAIVAVTTGLNPWAVTTLAFNSPDAYAAQLTAVHHQVAGFGGAFLFMVAFGFFFEEKTTYWIDAIEERLAKFGQIEAVAAAITLAISYIVSANFVDAAHGTQFFVAAVWGVVTFIIAHGIGAVLGGSDDADESGDDASPVTGAIIKQGIAGFLYLELLDASFSFDGVIGAFVLSNYLPVIALGLGIGAFFVRSMTIHLVEAGTLSEYRFLEHGAFYAIIVLAMIMYMSGIGIHLPEWVTGLTSGAIIVASFFHSHVLNKRELIAAA